MFTDLFSKLSFAVLLFIFLACNANSGGTKNDQDTSKNSQDTSKTSQDDSKTNQDGSKDNQDGSKNNQSGSVSDTIRVKGCQENPIRIKEGAILEFKLEAVPGSGYQWLQKDKSQLLKLLDADNLKFTRPETTEPTPGASGFQILHFKANKEGKETLRLEYKRTWESELMNSCDVKIEVSKT